MTTLLYLFQYLFANLMLWITDDNNGYYTQMATEAMNLLKNSIRL